MDDTRFVDLGPRLDLLLAGPRQVRQEIVLREEELPRRGGAVMGPDPNGAVPATESLASEGFRTVPPREHSGIVGAAGNVEVDSEIPVDAT